MHTDDGGAAAVNGGTMNDPPQSTDITFQGIDWIGDGRSSFQNANTVSVLNSAILRDPTFYPNGQLPCYGSGGGGLQFNPSQKGGNPTAITYGNLVQGFSATGTADDSIAFYNDVGGSTAYASPAFPQSSIGSSTITSPDGHPIRLANDYTVTKIPDNTDINELDSGTCPITSPQGLTGSPVCVDPNTQNQILSSAANCDTDFWDYPASQGGWGIGCPIWYSYKNFNDLKPF
jgi:hypothetical protein